MLKYLLDTNIVIYSKNLSVCPGCCLKIGADCKRTKDLS